MLGGVRKILSRLFRGKSKDIAAKQLSELARIREDRRAALAAFNAALDRGDTRGQCATQPAAIQTTNAALRVGR